MVEFVDYRESVRHRPGMYVGSTGPAGRLHLVLELVGNALDLVLHGRAHTIDVTLHDDGSVEVSDDGPGLDISDPEIHGWFTAGHQRPTADGHYPHVHLVGWGVGAAVVNFLSTRFRIVTLFEGTALMCEWLHGGSKVGRVSSTVVGRPGTAIRFWPDSTIFDGVDVPADQLRTRLMELACLVPGLRVSLDGEQWLFSRWEEGLAMLGGTRAAHGYAESVARVDGLNISMRIALFEQDVALQGDHMIYANYRHMGDEGPFTRTLRRLIAEIDEPPNSRGSRAVVSLTMLEPSIGGPTRSRLEDPRAVRALEELFKDCGADLHADSRTAD